MTLGSTSTKRLGLTVTGNILSIAAHAQHIIPFVYIILVSRLFSDQLSQHNVHMFIQRVSNIQMCKSKLVICSRIRIINNCGSDVYNVRVSAKITLVKLLG